MEFIQRHMEKLLSLIVIYSSILYVSITEAALPCISRNFGKSSIVCVCNATYCDTLDPVITTPRGLVTVYTTSREGSRFKKNTAHFEQHFSRNDYSFILDRNTSYQTIIGFGGAFTESAAFNIFNISSEASSNLIKAYYSEQGIEFNMGRVPIGGTDFSLRKYSNNPVENDFNMENFKLVSEDLELKIPLIQAAQRVSKVPLKLLTLPWSSPSWMKTVSPYKNLTQDVLKGNPGGPYFKAFARYIVKFLDAYKKMGIHFWGISPQNEPKMGLLLANDFGVGFVPATLRDFVVKDLVPALNDSGYSNLTVIVFDEETSMLFDWIPGILEDEKAAKYIKGIGVHWYADVYVGTLPLASIHALYPKFFILTTESCTLGTALDTRHLVNLGDWYPAEEYAYRIIDDMNNFVNGWIIWNLALNMHAGPLIFKTLLLSEAPINVDSSKNEFYKQPTFYALGHFSKFIPPESVRISIRPDPPEDIGIIAFVRPDRGTVVVAVNRSPWDKVIAIGDENLGYVYTLLPGSSIQTLIWWQ